MISGIVAKNERGGGCGRRRQSFGVSEKGIAKQPRAGVKIVPSPHNEGRVGETVDLVGAQVGWSGAKIERLKTIAEKVIPEAKELLIVDMNLQIKRQITLEIIWIACINIDFLGFQRGGKQGKKFGKTAPKICSLLKACKYHLPTLRLRKGGVFYATVFKTNNEFNSRVHKVCRYGRPNHAAGWAGILPL